MMWHLQWIFAGALMGAAHLTPALGGVAFCGLALLLNTAQAQSPGGTAFAWIAAATLTHAVSLFWIVGSAEVVLSVGQTNAIGLAAIGWLLGGSLTGAPGALAMVLLGRRARPFLALSWLAGEILCERSTGFPGGHIIYGQWANTVVLKSLFLVGWWPTCLICVLLAETVLLLWKRRRHSMMLVLFVWLNAGGIFSRTQHPPEDLAQQLGVWPMTTFTGDSSSWPEGVDLVIWPEVTERSVIRGVEGPIVPPAKTSLGETGVIHLRGGLLETPLGIMNAAFVIDEHGSAIYSHGKRWLTPVGERPLFGWSPSKVSLLPGTTSPVVVAGGRRVLVAICFEAYKRSLFSDGLTHQPVLVAALASDRPLGGSRIAVMQQIGVLALRAAEYKIPVVRASKGGQSAFIDAFGGVSLLDALADGER